MKKIILSLIVLSVFSLFSCTKKEAAQVLDNFSASIGTTAFSTTAIDKTYSASTFPTQLTITANGSNGAYVVLALKNFDKNNALGTYTISSTGQGIGAYHKAGTTQDEIAL